MPQGQEDAYNDQRRNKISFCIEDFLRVFLLQGIGNPGHRKRETKLNQASLESQIFGNVKRKRHKGVCETTSVCRRWKILFGTSDPYFLAMSFVNHS